MPKRKINHEEVLEYVKSLSFTQFKEVVREYEKNHSVQLEGELNSIIILDLQQRLQVLDVNKCCPSCGSPCRQKYGKRNGVQTFRCTDCKKRYTLFTGTILEKSRLHWDIWVRLLEMTLNDYSVPAMMNVLKNDYGLNGLEPRTVWQWRMKLIHALASLPLHELTGVIQIDETFVREAQKGSRELVSYLSNEERKPRYGRVPSKYGVMGSEFAAITTAIDNRGYSICKVTSLGRLTYDVFVSEFEEHIIEPAYICTDANNIYRTYCEMRNIPHYEKPSNYDKILSDNGYDPSTQMKDSIIQKLYELDMTDHIYNMGRLSYKEFKELKENNKLSLARVNELHADIKAFINVKMKNVSTKYLQDYIGYFCFRRNWRVDHGRYPTSRIDAEELFVSILKSKVNYTIAEIEETKLVLPTPTKKYLAELKKETATARYVTNDMKFEFEEEDNVANFNKREYLLSLPKSRLYDIAKRCGMKKYRKLAVYSLVSALLRQPDLRTVIYQMMRENKTDKEN